MRRHHVSPRAAVSFVAGLAVLIAGLATASGREGPRGPEAAFESLRLAVMMRDREASRFFNAKALSYYDGLLATAQGGRGAHEAGLDFEERAIVDALRRYAPAWLHQAPSSAVAVRELLSNEQLSVAEVEDVSLEDVRSDGRAASGTLAVRGQRTPLVIHYQQAAGQWGISGVHVHPGFLALLERAGLEPELDPKSVESLRFLWAAFSK